MQVLLIGDMPPNTDSQIEQARGHHHGGEGYWRSTHFAEPTTWHAETGRLAASGVQVHTFHLTQYAAEKFKEIARQTNATNRFLDVGNPNANALLTDCVTTELLRNIGGDSYVETYHAKFGFAGDS
jgi:hypothetical protein